MNICIVGYGKMGQLIEQELLLDSRHSIVHIAYSSPDDVLRPEHLQGVDVAIDFSHSSLMERHIELYCDAGVNAVIGTTNWIVTEDMTSAIKSAGIGVVVGSNFSAGVQVFLQAVRQVAAQLNSIGGYDVFGYELHHAAKADSPSGTAKTIADAVLQETQTKQRISYDRIQGIIPQDTLHFASLRGGGHSGLHEVTFDSASDAITLTHNAHGRLGFARGAIAAVEYAQTHTGYIQYEDLFNMRGENK